ncbi:MAG: SulP family inorganic anion transporter [Saprospiraceae bacterium]
MIDRNSIKGDIFGGVTAGIVALPLALAFGVQSGMGAIAGLYGAISLGILAAIFGGTNTQISGPTGPMTVVSAVTIAMIVDNKGSLEIALPSILLCFILAGAFMVMMGVLRIGQYIKYIPYPVVSGFMSGIGVIIIFLQLFPMLGYASPKTIVQIVTQLGDPLSNIHWPALILTILTMATIYIFPLISKVIPSTLVALLLCTVISVFFAMEVDIIGEIPSGLPTLYLESFSAFGDISLILLPAITLAALGAIDSLLTSVVADNITKTSHNSNKELIGQGIGNMAAGLIGGIPGAGATMRTMVNIKSGGKTKLSGVIHGFLLILIILGLHKWVSLIPQAVLAGILITVGIGILDRRGLKDIFKIGKPDTIVMIIVLLLTVFVDLLQAVGIGTVISCILFMKQMGDTTEKESSITLEQLPEETAQLHDSYEIPNDLRKWVGIKQINGPLFFGNSEYFLQLSKKVSPDIKVLILDMSSVPYIDQSGLYALESILLNLEKNNIHVFLLHIQKQPEALMRNISLIPLLIEENTIFKNKAKCIESIKPFIQNQKKI